VVAESDGVVKLEFVCPAMAVPPDATVYQRYCPFVPPDAFRVTEALGKHALAPVVVGAAGNELMVAVTDVRVLSQLLTVNETK
jgi:hypothetical protein